MLEIVKENINDLEFLKILLIKEIEEVKIDKERNLMDSSVKKRLISLKKNIDSNKEENDLEELNLEKKLNSALDDSNREQKIQECDDTLKYYQQILRRLDSLVVKNGIVYNEETKEKKKYSLKEILFHIARIKQKENLPLIVNEEELNSYIRTALSKLQEEVHYEDDELVEKLLILKIYQNPQNYTITLEGEPDIISLKEKKLTKREKEAFYGKDAYASLGIKKEEVKRRGVKKI